MPSSQRLSWAGVHLSVMAAEEGLLQGAGRTCVSCMLLVPPFTHQEGVRGEARAEMPTGLVHLEGNTGVGRRQVHTLLTNAVGLKIKCVMPSPSGSRTTEQLSVCSVLPHSWSDTSPSSVWLPGPLRDGLDVATRKL